MQTRTPVHPSERWSVGELFTRVSTFFLKELWAAVRQPRLVLSVVLGPFLILLVFGLAYRGQTPRLATTLVLPDDPRLPEDPSAYRDLFSSVFVLDGVTRDRRAAEAALAAGATDVVIVAPDQAEQTVSEGQHARFEVLFRQSDPLQATWVRYFAEVAVQELNRRVLADFVGDGQRPAAEAVVPATQLREQTEGLEADLRDGNAVGAVARVVAVRGALGALRSTRVLSLSSAMAGKDADPTASMEADLDAIEADRAVGLTDTPEQLVRASRLRMAAQEHESRTRALTRIPPSVLVAPFAVDARNTVPVEPTAIAYFAPAVIALLLQHIAVSLAALSMVRDRLLGTVELYRVAPIAAAEIIVGKSLSFGLLLSVVAVLLVLAVHWLLNVPLLGDVRWVALSLGILLFASLALGFFLATLAKSETQAVQLAMLVLLSSMFFGGFFLALATFDPAARVISYLLPVTYGSIHLRDVMLAGVRPDPLLLLAPGVLGLVLYLLAARSLNREISGR